MRDVQKVVWRRAWMLARALLLVLAVAGPCQAQPRTIGGVVADQAGLPIPSARVLVESPAGVEGDAVQSDREGRFVVRVPAGEFSLRVERARFETARVPVPSAATQTLRVTLLLAPLQEHVSVSPPVVDATTLDGFGSTSTVVSETQIEQLNAVDLAAALRRTPGVTISRFNPVGAFGGEAGGAVFVRGTGMSRPGSEVKAYVDGVPFYMGIWGHPLLDLLPLSSLERVAVHKGPQPQHFGNAFAAVDLATRRAREPGFTASVRASAGAFATVLEQAELHGRFGAWDLSVSQGFARSDGHRPGADGRLASGFARLGRQVGRGWSLAASVLAADNDAGDPGIVGQPETRTGRFATAGVLASVSVTHVHARVSGAVQAYANRGEGNWFGQPAPDGDTRTRFGLSGVRWREAVRAWGDLHVSAGLDVDRTDGTVHFDRVAPSPRTRFDAEAQTLVAPHAAVDRVFVLPAGWSLQPSVGVRAYAHSVFRGEATPHAGLVLRARDRIAIRATAARGVTYPGQEVVALSQVIPALGDSWRQLRPETVTHVEVGAAVTPVRGSTLDLAWFRDAYARRYVFAFPPAVARPTFLNLGAHRVRGVEASWHQDLGGGWRGFAGATWLETSLPQLPYVPARAVVAAVTGQVGPLRVAVDVQHQSAMVVLARARAAAASNPTRVNGFTVVNARPSWVVPRSDGRVEVFVAIDNLFDRAYAYRPGYPMPGASAQAGVVVRARQR